MSWPSKASTWCSGAAPTTRWASDGPASATPRSYAWWSAACSRRPSRWACRPAPRSPPRIRRSISSTWASGTSPLAPTSPSCTSGGSPRARTCARLSAAADSHPGRRSTMAIVDSQVHCYEANTPKRPWHSVPNWPPSGTGDETLAPMHKVCVDGAIFISAFSMYRYDASYAVEVQRAHPGRFGIVKPVDPDDPAVADVIVDWKKTPGTVGIRIMMTKEAGRAPDDPGLDRILRAAVRYDFPVNMLCWGNVDAGAAIVDRHPDTRFIIDHLAIMQPRTRADLPAQPWADLPKVLDLAKRRNAVIKVSGACTLSREPYPFPDIW